MTRYYQIKWDDSLAINRKWCLPPSDCPQCSEGGQPGYGFPRIDLTGFSNQIKFSKLNPNKSAKISWEEFSQLRATIKELTGTADILRPCTDFGPLVGRVLAGAKDFGGDLYFYPCVSHTALAKLKAEGITLNTAPTEIRPRPGKEQVYHEIVAPAMACLGSYASSKYCGLCGSWSVHTQRIKRIVVSSSLDSTQPIVRVRQWMEMVLCTEEFKAAVERLKLKGLVFIPVELVDEPLPEMPEGAYADFTKLLAIPVVAPSQKPESDHPKKARKRATHLTLAQSFEGLQRLLKRATEKGRSARCEVVPPITREQVTALAETAKFTTLPKAYGEFLTQASAGIDYQFSIQPEGAEEPISGGARLFMADKLVDDLQSCNEWATDTWIADSEEDQELWLNGLPFVAMRNGDYLALDLRSKADDPPVLYLSHDDASSEIAPSLTAFLSAWERLGYIGPESWVLEPYLNDQGHLSAEGEAAQELRRLLGIPE